MGPQDIWGKLFCIEVEPVLAFTSMAIVSSLARTSATLDDAAGEAFDKTSFIEH